MNNEVKYTLESSKFNPEQNTLQRISENDDMKVVALGATKLPDLEKTSAISTPTLDNPTLTSVPSVQVPAPADNANMFNGIPSQMVSDVQAYMGNEEMSAQNMQITMPTNNQSTDDMKPADTNMNQDIQLNLNTVQKPDTMSPFNTNSVAEHTDMPTIINPLENPLYGGVSLPNVKIEQPTTGFIAQNNNDIAPVTPEPVASVMPEPVAPVTPEPIAPVMPESVAPVTPEPVAPVMPEPVAPVMPEPVAPVMPEPIAPVMPEPVASVVPEPVAPVVPEPVAPISGPIEASQPTDVNEKVVDESKLIDEISALKHEAEELVNRISNIEMLLSKNEKEEKNVEAIPVEISNPMPESVAPEAPILPEAPQNNVVAFPDMSNNLNEPPRMVI